MATVTIVKRSQKTLTLIVDYGIDPVTKKRKKTYRALYTLDMGIAEAERLRVLAELANNTYKPDSKATIEEYFDYWFETPIAKKLDLNTQEHYKLLYDSRIKPWIGKTKLAALTRGDLYDFYDLMIEVGHLDNLKPKNADKPKKSITKTTIEHYHRLIRRVLNHALLEDEIIRKNVANKMALPDPKADEDYDPDEELVKVLSQEEIQKLEETLINHNHGNLVAVALRTGMRREELLAVGLYRRKRGHYLY